jgi:hypothetical protein
MTREQELEIALRNVSKFLRGVAGRPELGRGAIDLFEEAEIIDRLLGRQIKIPSNPDCVPVHLGPCGTDAYYCSDRCWRIGQLTRARARVTEYERQLGVDVLV